MKKLNIGTYGTIFTKKQHCSVTQYIYFCTVHFVNPIFRQKFCRATNISVQLNKRVTARFSEQN